MSEFAEIPISEFLSGSELPVDLFIRISEEKTIQIAKAGEKVELQRLSTYQSKNVTHLLVRSADYSKYLRSGLRITSAIVSNAKLPQKKRQSVLIRIAKNVFSELERLGVSKETLGFSKEITQATISFCQTHPTLSEISEIFAQELPSLSAHSIAVSTVATMIGIQLNWKSVTLEKLSLGGLLHDVGLLSVPSELLIKPMGEMTEKERSVYESHVQLGAKLLQAIPGIPDDVIAIALEHHEHCNGKGWPNRIRTMNINPLARVAGMANAFVELTTVHHGIKAPLTPNFALFELAKGEGRFWDEAFEALRKIT